MTYVVTESCIKCKYTDCVDVCPVDCFREGPNMLVIDPEECIHMNAELAKMWPPIIERKPAPPDADEWAKVKEKRHLLEK